MIMGLIEPTSGSIRVFGHDMAHERHHVSAA
jgi:ABC-type multidrug transport system ATPase subunit